MPARRKQSFCEDLSHLSYYRDRDAPPARAGDKGCRGKIAEGNDGISYISTRRSNGVYYWKKLYEASPRRRKRLPTSPAIRIVVSPRRRRSPRARVSVQELRSGDALRLRQLFLSPRYQPVSRRVTVSRLSPRQVIARRAEKYIRDERLALRRGRGSNAIANAHAAVRASYQQRSNLLAALIEARGRPGCASCGE